MGEQPYSRSPFDGLKSRLPAVPLLGRALLLASVTIALFVAILVSYSDESLVLPVLIAGGIVGLTLAAVTTVRGRR
jgi:hypothetical protein